MAKIMIFIDGTWLYSNTPKLAEDYGVPDLHIDYGVLPKVLGEKVKQHLQLPEVDIVRTFLFGSVAVNYDLRDDEAVQQRADFFNMLKEEFHYEVEVFPINFRGRRIRKKDRNPNDTFEPKEKCVDIALTTALLYYVAIPHAYDIAVVVIGDKDYLPVLQHVRRLGKRVCIVSIKDCCAPEYSDSLDRAKVKDMDIIWLNDIIPEIELKYERQLLECQSPLHVGERKVWTTFHPRKGQVFYCDECRKKFAEQKAKAQKEFVTSGFSKNSSEEKGAYSVLRGKIEKIVREKGYGFIEGEDGQHYFFHLTDVVNGRWNGMEVGSKITFNIKKEAGEGKAGAAGMVKLLSY